MMLLKRLYMIALKSYAIDTSRFVKKKKKQIMILDQ